MTAPPSTPRVAHAVITGEPLSVTRLAAVLRQSEFGAVFSFEGVVRDHDDSNQVVDLEYVAHPSASEVMERLAAECAADHPECVIAVAHRIGRLAVGDAAFVAVVASAHRGAAFAACFDIVETVKAELPIWKSQQFADGSFEWVNCA